MTVDATIHGAAISAFIALMLWAAIEDFRTYKIPNFIPLAAAAIFPVYVLSAASPLLWVVSIGAAAIVLIIGFFLFATGSFGAGDAKLLTATVLWVGHTDFLVFLLVVSAATILLVPVTALRAAWQQVSGTEQSGGTRAIGALSALRFVPIRKLVIPYGVAIAAGGVAVALARLSGQPF